MGRWARFIFIAAALLAFAPGASAQRGGKGGSEGAHMLNAAETREALEGRVICLEPRGRACSSAYVIEEVSETRVRGREYALNRISDWVSGPMGEFVQSTVAYREAAPLFQELGALQRAGRYEMVKFNALSESVYDPERNAWCGSADAAQPLQYLAFYFSRDDRADTSADEALPPELMQRLRAFFVAFVRDPVVAERIAEDPDIQEGIEGELGLVPMCTSYVGLRRNGRMTVTEIVYSTPRAALRSWRTAVEVREPSEIVLSPNID
ncbi:hypothetical protein [Terricaulis sp.]|uniref:hypothetical protein n=1 Tax=Terricaulis sp. TaxID=2768686 RepID=UPI0037848BE2